jgi:hypothetical protein
VDHSPLPPFAAERSAPPAPEVPISPFQASPLTPAYYDPPHMPEEHLPQFRAAASANAQEPVGGAIEDTTAELLRPMLRQWLADNMPRMVEKALHIEVAESVRTGRKLTGQ